MTNACGCWPRCPSGRVGFVAEGEVVMLPVNHLVDGTDVVFCTAFGSKLAAAECQNVAAFEADHYDRQTRSGWSVLVSGRVELRRGRSRCFPVEPSWPALLGQRRSAAVLDPDPAHLGDRTADTREQIANPWPGGWVTITRGEGGAAVFPNAVRRWLYRHRHASRLARVLNAAQARLAAAGVGPRWLVMVEVTGRRGGRTISFPAVIADCDNGRYLVSKLGEDTNWVRNIRASGGRAVLRHADRELVMLQEVEGRPPRSDPALLPAARTGARAHTPVDPRRRSKRSSGSPHSTRCSGLRRPGVAARP